jgi:hypothetical protein
MATPCHTPMHPMAQKWAAPEVPQGMPPAAANIKREPSEVPADAMLMPLPHINQNWFMAASAEPMSHVEEATQGAAPTGQVPPAGHSNSILVSTAGRSNIILQQVATPPSNVMENERDAINPANSPQTQWMSPQSANKPLKKKATASPSQPGDVRNQLPDVKSK